MTYDLVELAVFAHVSLVAVRFRLLLLLLAAFVPLLLFLPLAVAVIAAVAAVAASGRWLARQGLVDRVRTR